MELIRLYVAQDNRRWEETIPASDLMQRAANLEISGATIEHASKVKMTRNSKRKQRSALVGPARHLYA